MPQILLKKINNQTIHWPYKYTVLTQLRVRVALAPKNSLLFYQEMKRSMGHKIKNKINYLIRRLINYYYARNNLLRQLIRTQKINLKANNKNHHNTRHSKVIKRLQNKKSNKRTIGVVEMYKLANSNANSNSIQMRRHQAPLAIRKAEFNNQWLNHGRSICRFY